eukprot:g24161.t1
MDKGGEGKEYVSGGGIPLELTEMAADDLLDVDAGGMVVDICGLSISRNGNRNVEKGKGGVRDRPGESEHRVEIGSEIDELCQFRTREGSSTNDIIDVSEKELWVGAGIGLEQGMSYVPHEET